MEKEIWGWELIINCSSCDIEKITNGENIKKFVHDLIERINMEAWGPPLLEHFATHDPEKAGYSVCQMITTSAITGHFVDINGDCYLNIFSCKPFEMQDALDVVNERFNPKKITTQYITRVSPD